MNGSFEFVRRHTLIVVVAAFLLVGGITSTVIAAVGDKAFLRSSVDIGVVVADIDKSAQFYTKAIGFREAEGFSMSGAVAEDIGLTDGAPLDVRVFQLDEEKSATKLKLIELPSQSGGSSPENKPAIDSQLGFRYITIFVSEIDAALKRLQEAGIKISSDAPVKLGDNATTEIFIVLVHDPDGNLIELVGPKKGGA